MAIHCPKIFELIVEKAAQVVNILNVTEKSRLGARKLNGAKRKSRTKPPQASLPLSGVPSTDNPFAPAKQNPF